MKAETVVTEIADSVEEVSEVSDMIILVIKGIFAAGLKHRSQVRSGQVTGHRSQVRSSQ